LANAGESYGEHLRFAATVGLLAVAAGLACVVHAIIPALCQRTASRTIGLIGQLFDRRDLLIEVQDRSIEVIAFVVLVGLATCVPLAMWGSGAPTPLIGIYTILAFSLPATLLLTNRELDCPA
jgi:hypothetical protein